MIRRLLAIALALTLIGPAIAAGPEGDIPLTDGVGPEGIERLAQVLRSYQAGQVLKDAKLRAAVQEMIRRFPEEPPQKVIDRVRRTIPTLPPADQALLADIVKTEHEAEQTRRKAAALASMQPVVPPAPGNSPPQEVNPATPTGGGQTPKVESDVRPSQGGPAGDPKPASPSQPKPAAVRPPPDVTRDQAKQFGAVAGWWEKNVGPLDATPAVKDVITDVIKTATPASGKGPLADLFGSDDAQTGAKSEGWMTRNLGDIKLSDLGSLNWDRPPAAEVGVPSGAGLAAGGSLLLPLLAAAALGLGWYFWRKAPLRQARRAARAGLGPWPLDPRRISTREELIRAFEYLSLKTLGPTAAHAHHVALTAGLRDRHPAAADAADELGDLYAVARYAPADDPFPADGLPAARAAFGRLGEGPA